MATKRVREQLDCLEGLQRDLRDTVGMPTVDNECRQILANSIEIALRVIRTDLNIKQRKETATARALREEAGL